MLGELADDLVAVQADGFGVGADKRPTEDARGPSRHVIPLQRLEERPADLRVVGDRLERDLTTLTLVAKAGPKS
jgi:hypothetical protein